MPIDKGVVAAAPAPFPVICEAAPPPLLVTIDVRSCAFTNGRRRASSRTLGVMNAARIAARPVTCVVAASLALRRMMEASSSASAQMSTECCSSSSSSRNDGL